MFTAAFIWEPGVYDADFDRLNGLIDATARALPGYLGVEVWQNADASRKVATYYWDSLEALRAFSTDPVHQEAKRQYARWYRGYHVVVSEVLRAYGDGAFEHITGHHRHGGFSSPQR
ncbi:MAG: DUF4188 domain-containing protein [Xanthomonadaceae bacterium]|nr:DUF4188 domain-containing protein [Xanthomonadaceae bacterium]